MANLKNVIRNFISKISFGDCWEWQAFITDTGYGYYTVYLDGQRKNYRAHRFSWIIHNGPIPDGMHVLHKCDNKKCVNPDHLYLGTQSDNIKDALDRGQMTSETQGKLGWDDVKAIRNMHLNGVSNISIASIFNVSRPCISNIITNRTWTEG